MKVASLVLQLLGLGFTLLGVAEFRTRLQKVADATRGVKRGAARWRSVLGEAADRWWSHRRGRPVAISRSVADGAGAHDTATATVSHVRADRATISDRDWLILHDDRIHDVLQRLERAEQTRVADNRQHNRRLHDQQAELSAQLLEATRYGWELIVVGLLLSIAGIVLGFWA